MKSFHIRFMLLSAKTARHIHLRKCSLASGTSGRLGEEDSGLRDLSLKGEAIVSDANFPQWSSLPVSSEFRFLTLIPTCPRRGTVNRRPNRNSRFCLLSPNTIGSRDHLLSLKQDDHLKQEIRVVHLFIPSVTRTIFVTSLRHIIVLFGPRSPPYHPRGFGHTIIW